RALAEAEKRMRLLSVEQQVHQFVVWRQELRKAQEAVLLAQRQVLASDGVDTRALLQEAELLLQKIEALRKDQAPVLYLIRKREAPLAGELKFLLALTKHEQAERTQARLDQSKDK